MPRSDSPPRSGPEAGGSPEPSLDRFTQRLRPYQEQLVDDALAHVEYCATMNPQAEPSARRILYSMPTGTGKGTAELALLATLRSGWIAGEPGGGQDAGDLRRARDAWIFTPSLDVLRGYLERCGADRETVETASEDKLAEMGRAIFVTTPTRAQRLINQQERPVPEVILYDEVHHAIEGNDVSGTLMAYAPLSTWIGFTATPYRGTPKGTAELNEAWPNQVEALTIPQAIALGAWALPRFEVVPLVDDDTITVSAGDFQAKSAGKLVGSRVAAVAALVRERWDVDPMTARVPTTVCMPNTETAGLLVEELDRIGVPARRVGADTSAKDRALAYAECREGRGVLVSVKVISEGVDFPWLGRIIDARPTLSPVAWLQLVGRITRPKAYRPEYICVCRNLERHAYLLQGAVPREAVAQAQQAFEAPSKRAGMRSVGFEALARFKPIEMPLVDGVKGTMFTLYSTDENGVTTEWVALLDPVSEQAVTARRLVQPANPDGSRASSAWGKWERAPIPESLEGFATSQRSGELSDKQRAWWERAAARFGLDPAAARITGRGKITQRQFACLPVLSDLRASMRGEEIAT